MAKRAPGKRTSAATGRTTPKGTGAKGAGSKGKAGAGVGRPSASSGRYTPPIPKEQRVSPRWVPFLMFFFLVGGAAVILLNYVSLLPGAPDNLYLLTGLGLILVGFIVSTRYH
ncbi:MAG: cell division protein CrgA [Acidimicrobiales bacterium]